jgi:hypothetical protein
METSLVSILQVKRRLKIISRIKLDLPWLLKIIKISMLKEGLKFFRLFFLQVRSFRRFKTQVFDIIGKTPREDTPSFA